VRAAIAGLIAGLLVAAVWLTLIPATGRSPATAIEATVAHPTPGIRVATPPPGGHPPGRNVAPGDPTALPSAPATPDPSAHAAASPQQPQGVLPGFIAGPPPRAPMTDSAAAERNRIFLEAVRNRAAASR
jgi:hypothetical protein